MDSNGAPTKCSISGDNMNSLFDVAPTATLVLRDVHLRDGFRKDDQGLRDGFEMLRDKNNLRGMGGCIMNSGVLLAQRVAFTECNSDQAGGAIASTGVVTVEASTLSDSSSAERYGAGRGGGRISLLRVCGCGPLDPETQAARVPRAHPRLC